jgi:hypothetical protein
MVPPRAAWLLTFGLVMIWAGWARAERLPAPAGPVILTVTGAIEVTNAPGEARFDEAMLEALGRATIRTSTSWTDGVKTFEGVRLRAVLDQVGAKGTRLRALALNDYEIAIPMTDLAYEPILATHMDGERLLPRNKGPLWIVYPRDQNTVLQEQRFDHRWVWQLKRLQVE